MGVSSAFQYKNYRFMLAPSRFHIQRKRLLRTFQPVVQTRDVVPSAQIQDLGLQPVIVTGQGVLVGDELMTQYSQLYQVFLDQGSGLLHLPGLSPFYCYFEQLSMVGQAGPCLLTYEFSFLEDSSKNKTTITDTGQFYITRQGDTLNRLADQFSTTLEDLLLKNPTLLPEEELEEGRLLWI